MLLNSVILTLKEVLEAAVLFSILMALSRQSSHSQKWFIGSIILGTLGALIYGLNIDVVSQWFNGVGQEVINAFMQLGIYSFMVFFLILLFYSDHQKKNTLFMLSIAMLMMGIMAVTREGAEILLYLSSVTNSEGHFFAVLMGMTIGGSIGMSIGFLLYYLLLSLNNRWAMIASPVMLIQTAAGMLSHASLLLTQADWLPSHLFLWDTSHWLSEESVMGQLMFTLLNYEATPTAIQLIVYVLGLILPLLLIRRQLLGQGKDVGLTTDPHPG